MSLVKKLTRHPAAQTFFGFLAALYIRIVYRSSRWEIRGYDAVRDIIAADGHPAIGVFWHSRMQMMRFAWPSERPIHMLISQHRDGRLIARTIEFLGIRTVAGSSSRGGAAAARQLHRLLRDGGCIAITPDGPRGPRQRMSAGVVHLARSTGATILPAAYAARRVRIFESWDRFMLTFPFTSGVYVYAAPINVPADAEDDALEDLRLRLETALNEATAEADRACGHSPVQPADPGFGR